MTNIIRVLNCDICEAVIQLQISVEQSDCWKPFSYNADNDITYSQYLFTYMILLITVTTQLVTVVVEAKKVILPK